MECLGYKVFFISWVSVKSTLYTIPLWFALWVQNPQTLSPGNKYVTTRNYSLHFWPGLRIPTLNLYGFHCPHPGQLFRVEDREGPSWVGQDVCFNEITGNPNLSGFCQGQTHEFEFLFVSVKAAFENLQIDFCTFGVRVMLVSKTFHS